MTPTEKPRSIYKPLNSPTNNTSDTSWRVLNKSSAPIHQLIHLRYDLHQALGQAIITTLTKSPNYIKRDITPMNAHYRHVGLATSHRKLHRKHHQHPQHCRSTAGGHGSYPRLAKGRLRTVRRQILQHRNRRRVCSWRRTPSRVSHIISSGQSTKAVVVLAAAC
jgi:hypothetical protein